MLKIKKVAVTGGLSSGKSSVCRFFKKLGASVVSADEIVHQFLSPDTKLGQEVIHLFGQEIVTCGKIDRKKIASLVFNDPTRLTALESLLHPAVFQEIEKQYEEANRTHSAPLFVAEVPLLFEAHAEQMFDDVIVVITDEKYAKCRFKEHTHYHSDEYFNRIKRRIPATEAIQKASIIIENKGSLEDLETITKQIFYQLI